MMKFPDMLFHQDWIAIPADHTDGVTTTRVLRWLAANALDNGLEATTVTTGFLPQEYVPEHQFLVPGGAVWVFMWHEAADQFHTSKSQLDRVLLKLHQADNYVGQTYVRHTAGAGAFVHQGEHTTLVSDSFIIDLIVQLKLTGISIGPIRPNSYLDWYRPSGQFGRMAVSASARKHWTDVTHHQDQYQELIEYVDNHTSQTV